MTPRSGATRGPCAVSIASSRRRSQPARISSPMRRWAQRPRATRARCAIGGGRSVFETPAQARAIATRNGRATWSIASVTIPDNGPIPDERWGRNDGHHTLWGDPDYLFQCVTAVAPVTPERE